MKLDWDMVRDQLLAIEEDQLQEIFPQKAKEYSDPEDRRADNIYYEHLRLLEESGFTKGASIIRGADGGYSNAISYPRLTLSGYDLLEKIRKKSFWEKVKKLALDKGIPLGLNTISPLATAVLKNTLNI